MSDRDRIPLAPLEKYRADFIAAAIRARGETK